MSPRRLWQKDTVRQGHPALGEHHGQGRPHEGPTGNDQAAPDQVEGQPAQVKDQEQPLVPHADHEKGRQVVHKGKDHGHRQELLQPDGLRVLGAVNQGDDPVAFDEQHEHDHHGGGQQPAGGVLGQEGDFGAVHLPELDEEREQDGSAGAGWRPARRCRPPSAR